MHDSFPHDTVLAMVQYMSVRPSVRLSVRPSVRPSIHLCLLHSTY